jgi:hypothetical protein
MLTNRKITQFVKRHVDLADRPNVTMTSAELKAWFDNSPEELRVMLNAVIDDLLATLDGASGADNIGSTAITDLDGTTVQTIMESLRNKLKSIVDGTSGADFVNATAISGITGATVQALLESLKAYTETKDAAQTSALTTHKSSSDHDGRYFPKAEIQAITDGASGADKTGATQVATGSGTTVQTILEWLYQEIINVTLGQIQDGSLTDVKLSNAADQIKSRVAVVESELTNNQQQSSIIQRALSTILTDQDTPLWMVKLLGLTRLNHAGKQGGFHKQGQWDANLTIDTTVYKFGTSSGKIDNSTGTSAKFAYNTQRMYLQGKYIILGFWAKSVSGTPAFSVKIRRPGGSLVGVTKTINTSMTFYYTKIDLTAETESYYEIAAILETFGTANDVVNFDDLVIYELSSAEYSRAHTQAEIESEYGYVDSMQPTLNPWIKSFGKNLLPPFNQWTLHANATVISDYELEMTTTSGSQEVGRYAFKTIPNTDYTLTIKQTGKTGVYLTNGTTALVSDIGGNTTFTFNSGNNTDLLALSRGASVTGTFTFTNPQLELGSTATTFQPQNTDVSVIEGQLRGNPITGVYDSVTERDGHYWWTKRHEFKLFDSSLTWSYNSDFTGYKIVDATFTTGAVSDISSGNKSIAVKYDGSILVYASSSWAANRYAISSTRVQFSVADTDTGWYDTWTTEVSTDWIKAYFNGWKYTGTSDKLTLSWVSVYDGASSPTQTLAYVSANRASGMTDDNAYQLEYQLADSVEVDLGVVGGVSLFDGNNTVEYGEGMIVKELANPIYNSASGVYEINRSDGVYEGSKLLNRVKTLISVYEDTENFSSWDRIAEGLTGTDNGERFNISEADFDKTKQYYVSYLPLDKYLMTSNVIEVETAYATNLKSVVARNTQDISDTKNNVKDIEGDIERRLLKGEGEKVQKGTLAHTLVAAGSWSTANITFPIAYADVTTIDIDVTISVGATRYRTYEPLISNLTTTGFTLNFHQIEASGGEVTIRWKSTGK